MGRSLIIGTVKLVHILSIDLSFFLFFFFWEIIDHLILSVTRIQRMWGPWFKKWLGLEIWLPLCHPPSFDFDIWSTVVGFTRQWQWQSLMLLSKLAFLSSYYHKLLFLPPQAWCLQIKTEISTSIFPEGEREKQNPTAMCGKFDLSHPTRVRPRKPHVAHLSYILPQTKAIKLKPPPHLINRPRT